MTLNVQLVQADAAFGTDLYAKLAGPGNLVFSPASIAEALLMALLGARGDTAAELARALRLPSPEAAVQAQGALASIPVGGNLTLRVVNAAWIEEALSVRPEFLRQPVNVERVSFGRQGEAARQAINQSVAEQTEGKITGLIAPGVLDALTRLVLVDAIYLKARWRYQFPARQTRKSPFHPERDHTTQVDMMHLENRLAYYRGDGYQAVLLPYQGGPLAMAIVLPDGPLSEWAGRLEGLGGVAGVTDGLLASPEFYQVDLRLPKFKITAGFLLRDTLQALGVYRAFSDDADFSGICESERLHVSAVVHRAYIDVDEQGTEAAAATAAAVTALAAIRLPSRRVTFTADRPFLFAVVETNAGLPLFLGQLTRPG